MFENSKKNLTICESGGPLRFEGSGDDVEVEEVELEEEVAFLEL